ncbi:hypothetical protein Drorol1_Dr00012358 [Drosera rotundifolia]
MHVCADMNIGKLNERPLLKFCWGSYQSRSAHGCSSKLHVSNSISFSVHNAQSHATTVQCQHVTAPEVITRHRFAWDLPQNASSVDILIHEHTKNGCHEEAVRVYLYFISAGSATDGISSFSTLIKAIGDLHDIQLGRQFHGHNKFVVNGLLEMYMKHGNIKYAELVFDRSLEDLSGNTVLWNVMLLGYANNGCFSQALLLLVDLMSSGIEPDSAILVSALVVSSRSSNLTLGKQIHSLIKRTRLEQDTRVRTALMDMYFDCGDRASALKLFRRSRNRNSIMWGMIISNCAQSGFPQVALNLYLQYRLEDGLVNGFIVLASLRACSSLNLKVEGMELHGLAAKLGFDDDRYIVSALANMYMKAQDVGSAEKAFMRVSARDAIMGNAMMTGYAKNDRVIEALKAFRDMQCHGIRPNAVTILSLLSICALISVGSKCREVHGYVIRQGMDTNLLVSNSLITTYAKSGDMKSSRTIFDRMKERDAVSWNNVLLALGIHGAVDELFASFENMKALGVKPDKVTFTCVMSACSHAGRLDDGSKYFRSMVKEYGIVAELEQCNCIVDLLGRAGYLKEAHDLILGLPSSDVRIWGSLLGACQIHGNDKLAELVLP